MDDLRNSINASSEIQDLRSQLNKKYSEEEVIFIKHTIEFYWSQYNNSHEDNLKDWNTTQTILGQFKKNNL